MGQRHFLPSGNHLQGGQSSFPGLLSLLETFPPKLVFNPLNCRMQVTVKLEREEGKQNLFFSFLSPDMGLLPFSSKDRGDMPLWSFPLLTGFLNPSLLPEENPVPRCRWRGGSCSNLSLF